MPHKRACHWSPAVRGNWSFAQLWRYRFSPHGASSSRINCIPFGPNTCFRFSFFSYFHSWHHFLEENLKFQCPVLENFDMKEAFIPDILENKRKTKRKIRKWRKILRRDSWSFLPQRKMTLHNTWDLPLSAPCPRVWKKKWKSISHVWLSATPWTIQSMGFSMNFRPEYWSG